MGPRVTMCIQHKIGRLKHYEIYVCVFIGNTEEEPPKMHFLSYGDDLDGPTGLKNSRQALSTFHLETSFLNGVELPK